MITKSWEGGWCFSSGVRGSLWGLSSVGGVVVVGVWGITYPQPLRLLPARAQGARPLGQMAAPAQARSLARFRETHRTPIPALYNYTQSGHALPSAVQMQPRVGLLSIDPDRSTSGIRPLAKWLLGEA